MTRDMDLREKKAKVTEAQEKLLKRVKGSEKLEISWWKTCVNFSFLQFKGCECEENEIVAEEGCSLPREEAAVEGCPASERIEPLTLFLNEVGIQVLRDIFAYNPIGKDGSYVEGMTISITRLDRWVTTVVPCLVERKKHGGQRQKEYLGMYGRMVNTVTKQLIGKV